MPLPGKNVKKGGVPTLANLDQVLPWPAIRQALQIAETSSELPEVVICPLCSGALTAYPLDTDPSNSSVLLAGGPATASIGLLRLETRRLGHLTKTRNHWFCSPCPLSQPQTSRAIRANCPDTPGGVPGVFVTCRRISAMPNASADARPVKPAQPPGYPALDQAAWRYFRRCSGKRSLSGVTHLPLWPLCRGQRLAGIAGFHSAGTLYRFLVGALPKTECGTGTWFCAGTLSWTVLDISATRVRSGTPPSTACSSWSRWPGGLFAALAPNPATRRSSSSTRPCWPNCTESAFPEQ